MEPNLPFATGVGRTLYIMREKKTFQMISLVFCNVYY